MDWGYDIKILSGRIFACPKEGLFAVIDNRCRRLQSSGMHSQQHNVFSRDDLIELYKSKSLSKDTPTGFQTRLIFSLGLVTAMRPTALVSLNRNQFEKQVINGRKAWVVTEVIGDLTGSPKTSKGGWSSVGKAPLKIPIWEGTYLKDDTFDGISFYDDVDEYINIRDSMNVSTGRFFLSANQAGKRKREFFKRQNLGINKFLQVVKTVSMKEGVSGIGSKAFATNHGLRGTLASLLIQSGHSDTSVSKRTGHKDLRSLQHYQNLQGAEGQQQQVNILSGSNAGPSNANTDGNQDAPAALVGVQLPAGANAIGSVTGTNVTVNLNIYPAQGS